MPPTKPFGDAALPVTGSPTPAITTLLRRLLASASVSPQLRPVTPLLLREAMRLRLPLDGGGLALGAKWCGDHEPQLLLPLLSHAAALSPTSFLEWGHPVKGGVDTGIWHAAAAAAGCVGGLPLAASLADWAMHVGGLPPSAVGPAGVVEAGLRAGGEEAGAGVLRGWFPTVGGGAGVVPRGLPVATSKGPWF